MWPRGKIGDSDVYNHPHWSFMDNNRLNWIFFVSLYETTKIIDYNRLKMDYNDTNF